MNVSPKSWAQSVTYFLIFSFLVRKMRVLSVCLRILNKVVYVEVPNILPSKYQVSVNARFFTLIWPLTQSRRKPVSCLHYEFCVFCTWSSHARFSKWLSAWRISLARGIKQFQLLRVNISFSKIELNRKQK